jgi:hypothetical protein
MSDPFGGWDRVTRLAQAQGMISVQAACTLDDALTMIENRATLDHCSVDDVVRDVLDGAIRFGPPESN